MRAAAMNSVWGFGVAMVLLLALYAGCTNETTERRGGTDVPDLTAGSGSLAADGGAAGAVGEAGAGGATAGSQPVTWCAVSKVIACSCQQCHQNPPVHQAPFPILTYADTQQPYPSASSKKKLWQEMQTAVTNGYMPYLGLEDPPVEPPVQPLSVEDKATLLTWFDEGAHDEGGQVCPVTCDWSKGPP